MDTEEQAANRHKRPLLDGSSSVAAQDAKDAEEEPSLKKPKLTDLALNTGVHFTRCVTPPATHPASPELHRRGAGQSDVANESDDNKLGPSSQQQALAPAADLENAENGKVDSSGAMKPDVGSDENKTTGEIGNHNAPDSTMTNGEPHSEKPNIEAPLEKPAEAKFSFVVVRNDGTEDNIVLLMNAKKIFATQLPKMPSEYIVRLVMDRRHETLCLMKNDNLVIGGICYRPNSQQKFAEIAFCAIDSSEQVRGHGTRLMNELKERVKKQNISYFLTYADNYAIGYFKKQGFTKTISFLPENWQGYIKEYDGGTLMQCKIDKGVNYNKFSSMLKEQQLAIFRKIVKNTKAHYVYKGLNVNFANGETIDDEMEIPGVKECGWNGPPRLIGRRGKLDEDQTLPAALEKVYQQIYLHTNCWPFHKPVDVKQYPLYEEMIKEPIDMKLIRERLDNRYYETKDAFEVDIQKMCQNCRAFNGEGTTYAECADSIERFATSLIRRVLRSAPSLSSSALSSKS